ncbi:uncharacterized protein VICG_01788 [Vittaforma corneae ATCC 50505]|uniref:Uncharacterized protein n=1 Tax=Vittaforma corneae (strain ATCC 50505) TaxID=993615 RepID=L2GKP4_VITCO|nr:uncharacterized protein VICG_01788 [Vittaforma corneae ATCC 50505]ELA41189.1 hypothetical protein VICG_01788 [Vittaforma corneae ATCC 50505]
MVSSEEDERNKSTNSESMAEKLSEDSSSSETESSYDDEQDESYILLSNDELISEGSEAEAQEEDYFGSSSTEEHDESEAAWTDSDDDRDLRDELENEATWLHTDELPKKICRTSKKIFFKYTKHVFTAKCKVKLFKVFSNIKILVDSFNLIYFIKSFEDYTTFKIDFFKITDVCTFNGLILLSSSTSSYIKHVTLDGKVTDIKKGTGNIKKMVSDIYLYILGDKLLAFNSNLSLVNEFNHSFIDICIMSNTVICLTADGDIYTFDKKLNFASKHSLQLKFQFKGLYSVRDNLIIATEDGMIILDSDFQEIKVFSNLKEPISSLVSNGEFIIHGSPYSNSLRILKSDLTYYERFPFSKININPISTMSIEKNTIYFNDSRYISSLKLEYI